VRVLLVRAGALGDLLLLRGAIAGLQRAGHEVGLLAPAGPGSALIGPGLSEARNLTPWEDPGLAALLAGGPPEPRFAEAVEGYDLAVCYSRSAELADALARLVPRVVSHPPLPPSAGPHAAVWCLTPVRDLVEDGPVPSLVPTAVETDHAREILSRLPQGFPALHPGSGSPAKNWTLAGFAQLAMDWGGRGPWLLVLGPADQERAAPLSNVPGAIVARTLPPRALAVLLAQASVYVGNDSGVTHLAAAAGAPTLSLFGPTDPALWAPIGTSVRVLRGRDARVEAIGIEEVREAIAGLRGTQVG
jgi:ADP-heptose:LPS heptosyltransferase